MSLQVVMGATCMCTFGTAPSTLNVIPAMRPLVTGMAAANIMDNAPFVNVLPFAMCTSPANPAVAAATAAALGVLTPMPCTPVAPAPWAPGVPTVMVANMPALNDSSMLMCAYAGQISITNPGQTKELLP